ncbi:MAG: GNAT family N-acetyltransferase [Solirubrobacteraceae bacterium]
MTDPGVDAGIEEIDESRDGVLDDWERLAESVGANPFLHPGFVLAWQRAFGQGPLLLATIRSRGELTAAVPLVRRGAVLASPANWHTPATGLLAQDDDAATALAKLLIGEHPRRISLAFLDRKDAGTTAISAEARRAGYRILERTLASPPYRDLAGDWEAFESGMRSDIRGNLRRRRRRLEERGEVSYLESDGRANLDELLDEVVRVEAMGWKGEQGTAIGSRPDTLRFYRDVASWAADRGWLRIHLLRLDGQALAVGFALRVEGVHYVLKIGYDPEYRQLAPGMLLLYELFRGAFADGLRRVDMLGEDESYKRTWCPEVRECIGLQAFSPSVPGRLDHLVFTQGRPLAKRLASRGLLGRFATTDGPRL